MRAKDEILTGFATFPDTTDLLVTCYPADYSASAIARAVEDCDAHLLNLSVHPRRDEEGRLLVSLTANRLDGMAIARSLERYEFRVETVTGPGGAVDKSLRDRALEVIHYLEV